MLRIGAAIGVVLWVTALFLPVFQVNLGDASATYGGLSVLTTGFLGVLAGTLSWYANPYWLYATFRMARGSAPGPIAVTLNSLLAASFIVGFQMFGANESVSGPAEPQAGAWLWLASFAPSLLAGLSNIRQPVAST